jgi:hypothetical protein
MNPRHPHRADSGAAVGRAHRLTGPDVSAVDGEIAAVADRLLDVDLGGALASAWRRHAELTAAAERTRAAPGSEEVVILATHRVTWDYRPRIDVLVDGRAVTSLDLALRATFDLHAVVAVVRLGELVALRAGDCDLGASLAVEGVPLAQRQARLPVGAVVAVTPGIPLLAR